VGPGNHVCQRTLNSSKRGASLVSGEGTIRERIVKLLMETQRPLSASEIASMLGLPAGSEREVYEHLRHIAKTVRRMSGGKLALYMVPPQCKKCGYVFKLDKPRKPSKCPRCNSQWIDPPRFYIAEV